MAKPTEVIDLDSDDDSSTSNMKSTDKKIINANCINFKCTSGVDMCSATSFACAFYGVNMQKKKKRFICKVCQDKFLDHQEQLVDALLNHKPILKCDFPDHSMEVEISDSDESDDDLKIENDVYVSEDTLEEFTLKVDASLANIMKKYDMEYQYSEAHSTLKNEWDEIFDENRKLDDEITSVMTRLDSLRTTLYNEFKPQIVMKDELIIPDNPFENKNNVSRRAPPSRSSVPVPEIQTPQRIKSIDNSQNLQDSQPEILQEGEKQKNRPLDLPPFGNLIKPVPEVDDYVFTMKHSLAPWIKGKVQSIISKNPVQCKVKLVSKKYAAQVKTLSGRQMASSTPSSVIIPVGTRVVAMFQDIYSSNYYSGVVAEPPKSTNKYRYLIFFDDGYAQYVIHKHIFLVCESSTRIWDDVPAESREFVKKYMESYPERPMVKLQVGQVVKTEWNGKWWIARVSQVDASLVQMHFDADNRTEWIYRGSTRLGPLYVEFMKANSRQQGIKPVNTPVRRPTHQNKNGPYVEYTYNTVEERESTATRNKDKIEVSHSNMSQIQTAGSSNDIAASAAPPAAPQQSRAVAKKSTAKKQSVTETVSYNSSSNTETKSSHSIVYYQTQNKIQTKKYSRHKCGPKCVQNISFTPDDLRGYSPLSIPLLCGWNRQLCKFPKGKKVILYQAPCGIRLRSMEELHKYLRMTKCPMSVDLFEFDYWVHCLAEFVLDKCFVNIKDLSYGVENVPIPCVNELDFANPDAINYTTQRQPAEDVNLNTDPQFLCSCDCEDDCADKEKCQCWQLTIQGATLGGRVPNAAVGYSYKRLPEAVSTGIYECNSGCKCSVKTCLNRVVQHPLTLKLQVFKTAPRGWGIRCLNDIPLGSFICIYAGRLLTEQGANEGGKNYGDEYLAELDYVEVVEGIKEGYESDAIDPELPIDNLKIDENNEKRSFGSESKNNCTLNDSDEEYVNKKVVSKQVNQEDDDSRSSIRSRLRKRNKKDESSSSDSKLEDGNLSKDGQDRTGSDDEDNVRIPSKFDLTVQPTQIDRPIYKSVREFFGQEEAVYIMDAKTTGNIGRYLNHSCDPNVFVQNVFVDTHDVRFPWVAFFALNYIRAGQELTWNYSYDVGSIPGKVILCKCGSVNCRGRLL